MKTRIYATALLIGVLFAFSALAQDFSNKGKEFWLAYCYHVGMVNAGGLPTMTLYITSDVATTYNVGIYGGATIQSGSIAAGQVITVIIPTTYFIDNEGTFTNKAVRVTGDKPIVVYSYITRSAASGATLCLPTNVLGKEYYAMSFTQTSNEANSNSFFTIIAVEDNTSIEITPSANTKNGWLANSTYTINLNKGQIYQVLGTTSVNNGVDLSGSKIKSIASGTGGCKRIAVFSGSGKIKIPATLCSANSSDNLYQQLYPTVTWGKKYLTVPSANNPNNYFRVIKSTATANVYVNGTLVSPASFVNNLYYQFFDNTPNLIESDQPISVTQYFTTQGCDGNSANVPNDPDMIVLNPVEQNIDKVTLVNSNLAAASSPAFPHQHHIHVIMRNGGTGLSSFTLDGSPIPITSWITHPQEPNYSYLYLTNVAQGYHNIASDSGFNAIAYGYANAESYGYSAGANVKDLYQFVSIRNQYATVSFPAACKNSPFYFSMTFPYQPTQIQWQFSGLFTDVTVNSPVYDSTWVVNGKQLYLYKLTTPYIISTVGTYPIKVIAQNPTPDGCSGEQEINYDLQVFERPVADFSFTANGCVSDSVHFFDNTNTNGRTAIRWSWDFDDGGTDAIKNPVHLFATAGTFNVKYSVITDIGCVSDTVSKPVILNVAPIAKFGDAAPFCVGKTISFTDSSSSASASIVKWFWDFGDGSPVSIVSSNTSQIHSYATAGSYTVTLKVETATGCQSILYSKQIIIGANPVPDFSFGNACLPAGSMQFMDHSTISDGTQSQFTYQWSFADGGGSTTKNPSHNYASTGPFTTTLIVTSNAGCIDSITKNINTIYSQPIASFTAPTEICFGGTATFTDQSTATNSSVTQWQWDFGDGNNSSAQNPSHNYGAPGTYTITLTVTSAIGCVSSVTSKTIVVNALPVANFTNTSPDCATRNISFTDASSSASGNIIKWTWDLGDATNLILTNGNSFVHTYASAGTYTVSLKTETDKGCISAVVTKQIIVHPLPVAAFGLPDNCLTDPFSQFSDSSTIADGTQSQFTYQWNFNDPNANAGDPNTSTLKNPKHKYTVVGPYNVTLIVTSVNGCTDTLTKQFIVNSTQPVSLFSINGTNPVCSNSVISITNNSSIDVGRIVRLEIFWDQANDLTNKSTIIYPINGAVYNHSYPEFYSPLTVNYVIKVIAYSGDSCFNSSTHTITLKATPQVIFDPMPFSCADVAPFQITQTSIANGLPGNGVFSGAGLSSSGLFNPQTAGVGTHAIRYTFTGSNGCSNYKDQNITVYAVPTVSAGPDRFVLEGGDAVLLGTGSGNNISYSWTPIIHLNNPNIAQPITTPTDDITYTLKVTSADGCSAHDDVFVKFLKAPTIPNTFSPNGDGVHDVWEIKYLESYPGATVEIYNRYGQMIFQSTGYSKPWDGTYKGKDLPAGTYYYIINPKNGRKQIAGFVDIIR